LIGKIEGIGQTEKSSPGIRVSARSVLLTDFIDDGRYRMMISVSDIRLCFQAAQNAITKIKIVTEAVICLIADGVLHRGRDLLSN
jgi:hypothetical protein